MSSVPLIDRRLRLGLNSLITLESVLGEQV